MWTSIECAGHPRDMGLAQGGAFAEAIREACGQAGLPRRRSRLPSLRGLADGPLRGSGAGREFHRHFAHLAERLEGLARGANVPGDSVLDLHLRVREGGTAGGLLARRSALRAHRSGESGTSKRILLERSLPAAVGDESGWMLRESRPAVGFRSVEVGLPWLVPGVAGINEAGLAVMAGPILWGTSGYTGFAPSALLVQECLQRFEDLGGALDWCRKRPVEGEQSVVLADVSGAVATVISSGRERRIQEGEGELYLEGGEPAAQDADREGSSGRVVLDPEHRSLCIESGSTRLEVDLG
jgi:hypothetical protein